VTPSGALQLRRRRVLPPGSVGFSTVIFYGQADFRVQNVAKLRNKLKRSIVRDARF
jgi:hypothetical protein